jgi:hypothetical protein
MWGNTMPGNTMPANAAWSLWRVHACMKPWVCGVELGGLSSITQMSAFGADPPASPMTANAEAGATRDHILPRVEPDDVLQNRTEIGTESSRFAI